MITSILATKNIELTLEIPTRTDKVILDIPADIKYLETVAVCLDAVMDRALISEKSDSRFAVKLSVHETCANIIEHAFIREAGRIKLEINIFPNPAKIVVELFDHGREAELDHVSEPNLDEPQIKGYGLYLIKSLVDEFGYSREKGINRWTIVKLL